MTIHITGNLIVDDLVDNQEYIQLGGVKPRSQTLR